MILNKTFNMKDIHAIHDKEWSKIINRDKSKHQIKKIVDWFKRLITKLA